MGKFLTGKEKDQKLSKGHERWINLHDDQEYGQGALLSVEGYSGQIKAR